MPNAEVMGEAINIDNAHIAKVTADTADAYATGAAEYFAPIAELKHDAKSDSTLSYYDGGAMFAYPFEGEASEDATVSGLSEQKFAELTGKSFDPSTGAVFDTGDPVFSPFYAFGYRVPIGNGYNKLRWFLKGIFVPGSEDFKTKNSKVDPQNLSVTYKPLRTIHQWTIPDPRDASKQITDHLKVVRADTSYPGFAQEANWFSQVQTPDTFGAPVTLSLASSAPVNAATGVLASVKPTLTFSNPVASDSVLLLKSDGTVVAMAKSYDTTSKVLTISPLAALTAGAEYQLIVSGVKDIYGQALAPAVISFTVAS